jgi:hypothetical protein
LKPLAFEVEDVQAAFLVGPEDEAQRWVGRMDPDRRIVGGVSFARNRLGLDDGRRSERR